ncbi:MAG TPA: hypothetical protein VLS48_02795 [Anaerolineales bacterium]|nr:hypothetical protein [Anaerolineales bacterium]
MKAVKKIDASQIYKKYYIDRDYEQVDLFRALKRTYEIESAIYPGSYVHVSPSFIFPDVVYIDSDKNAIQFFKSNKLIDLINARKEYQDAPKISFYGIDYKSPIIELYGSFDLLISQYAGFVSEPCKQYLRIDGFLLVNNSHGDAGLASIDKDYQFVSTVHKTKGKYRISQAALEEYFIPKRKIVVTRELLYKTGKGVGYTKTAPLYIFQRIS